MKDKLVKTHHKAMYYRTRRISIACLLAVSASVMITVPTYYSVVSSKNETPLITPYSEVELTESVITFE